MNKFLALTFVWGASMALGILILIHGYGLEVKSWPWVIGGGTFGRLIVEVFSHIAKDSK